jgi:single-strand DNA-binding protein
MTFAKITLIGNLGADPELAFDSQNRPRLSMSVAVSERARTAGGEDKTTWYRVTIFGRAGADAGKSRPEKLAEFLRKGHEVFVTGRLEARTYEAKDGTTQVGLGVVADEFELLKYRPRESEGGAPAREQAPRPAAAADGDSQAAPSDLDDLPF